MIPTEKQSLVKRALEQAFGTSEFEEIKKLTGGLSTALVFRIVVKGTPYLLRVIMRTDALGDPTRQWECMKPAAEAGVAPRVWYVSAEDRILITDFVEAKPFPADFALMMARTIRKVHELPPFPAPTNNYFSVIDGFMERLKAKNILPENDAKGLFRGYAEIEKVYPRGDERVASHNDLKPQNIIYDGERAWLVDWEAAFLNDRYLDLAVVANFFVQDDAEEERYLSEYFGEKPDAYRRARFYLMQQITHAAYVSWLMVLAAGTGPVDVETTAPEFRDFHERMIAGEVDVATPLAKVEYAKVHLKWVLENMRTQRFRDALAVVRG
jgi:aminoglycoside phosphotransferase (APT) family kinase protein